MTFAALRPQATSSGSLELFYPAQNQAFSVPSGSRTADLATVASPGEGTWWLRQADVGPIRPRALMRFDLDVALVPRVVPRTGFETYLGRLGDERWAEVVALDANGKVLGRSKPQRL